MTSRIRRMFTAVAVGALVLFSATASAAPARAVNTSSNYAFFYTPHQDDEVLSMGAAIKEHVDAGRDVYVYLMTDGSSSQFCISQYGSRAACTAARDAEFIAGVKSMGAHPVIRPDRMVDGTLTVSWAAQVMNRAHIDFPNASFKTMSEFDASPDHSNLGKALRSLNITDSRWYIKQSEWATHRGSFTAKHDMNATLDLYAFGHISVPADFAASTYPTGNLSKYYHY